MSCPATALDLVLAHVVSSLAGRATSRPDVVLAHVVPSLAGRAMSRPDVVLAHVVSSLAGRDVRTSCAVMLRPMTGTAPSRSGGSRPLRKRAPGRRRPV